MTYDATMEFVGDPTPDRAEQVVGQLADFDAAVSSSEAGDLLVSITLEASSLAIATHLALGLAREFELELRRLEVLSTADSDRRRSIGALDDVMSVGEAAEVLGVSTQAIRQRLEARTLAGRKAGHAWHISRDAVEAAKTRQDEGTRVRRPRRTSSDFSSRDV